MTDVNHDSSASLTDSITTSVDSGRQLLIVAPTTSSSQQEVEDVQPIDMEEAFNTRKYVGSFKLRYQGDGSTVRKSNTQAADAVISETKLAAVEEETQLDVTDIDEEMGEAVVSTDAVISETKLAAVEETQLDVMDTDKEMAGDKEEYTHEGSEDFKFFAPEADPVKNIHPAFKQRATRAVRAAVLDVLEPAEPAEPTRSWTNQCFHCCRTCLECQPCKCPDHAKAPTLTPELKDASNQGFRMMGKLFFPAMPKILQDVWVYAELLATLFQFVYSITNLSLDSRSTFQIIHLLFSILALILALLDSFLYIIQSGSCAKCLHYRQSKLQREKNQAKSLEEGDNSGRKKWWQISPKWKAKLNEWFELVRNVISELIIYPLLILDLFDFFTGGSFNRRNGEERLDFSNFAIGSFYLVLSVYIIRVIMVIISAINLRRNPFDSSGSQKSYFHLVTWFCIHILAQIVAHLTIVVAIALKIFQENPEPCEADNPDCVRASPFLIYAAVVGGVLPLLGVIAFFFVNYYQLRQFSMKFWIDTLSLLQSESFADLVFEGHGIKESKQNAEHLVEKVKLNVVKKQFKDYKSPPLWAQVLYPFRVPTVVVLGILYELLVVSFIVSLMYTTDDGEVEFILFEGGLSSAVFIAASFVIIANLHVLLLATLWIVIICIVAAAVILLPIFAALALMLYLPVGACLAALTILKKRDGDTWVSEVVFVTGSGADRVRQTLFRPNRN